MWQRISEDDMYVLFDDTSPPNLHATIRPARNAVPTTKTIPDSPASPILGSKV
jgi:hypothetical protein